MRVFICVSCAEGCKRYIDTLGVPSMHGYKCPEGLDYICNFVQLIELECRDCGYTDQAHKFPDISQDPDDPAYCEPYCPICLSTSIVTGKYDDHISIIHVARELKMQNQYISHYLGGLGNYPDLSKDIRWYEESKGNYHTIRIHKGDIDKFIMRLAQARHLWNCKECNNNDFMDAKENNDWIKCPVCNSWNLKEEMTKIGLEKGFEW